jgi:hypothetical protein
MPRSFHNTCLRSCARIWSDNRRGNIRVKILKKNLQIQVGISVKHVAVDLIIDNEGIHFYIDTLGDVSQ